MASFVVCYKLLKTSKKLAFFTDQLSWFATGRQQCTSKSVHQMALLILRDACFAFELPIVMYKVEINSSLFFVLLWIFAHV